MGVHSDDPEIEAAVLAVEEEYSAARDAHLADVSDEENKKAYDDASTALANARRAARDARGGALGVVAETNPEGGE